MSEGTQHNVDEKMREFYEAMVVDLGRSRTTARVRKVIVASTLRELGREPQPADIDRRKRTLIMAGRTPDHARNMVFAFRDYFAFCGRMEEAAALTPPKRGKPKVPRYLTADEVRAILGNVEDKRDAALLYLIAYTGLRVHESLKLRPADINLETRTLSIVGKGGKSAVIPIGAPAIPHLREWLEVRSQDAETVFYQQLGSGGPLARKHAPLSCERVRAIVRRYARRAGITRRVTPHMFRHALATNLLEAGCPLPFVQRQLRHADIKTTMIYLHASDRAFQENFDRFLPQYG